MSSNPKLDLRFVPNGHSLLQIVGLMLVYFVVCKLGLRFAVVHPNATAVWAGTGIAMASILLLGYEVWPGIFLGTSLRCFIEVWVVQPSASARRPFSPRSMQKTISQPVLSSS